MHAYHKIREQMHNKLREARDYYKDSDENDKKFLPKIKP